MSWIAVAVAAVSVGTAVYSGDKQRKAMHQQADALQASQDADARQKAEAETGAAVAANSATAAVNARRRASALALGDPGGSSDTLGAPSGGASVYAPTKQAASTVLGSATK